jgi:hypothetical protein
MQAPQKLPASILFGLGGTGAIVLSIVVALAVRSTPFEDIDDSARSEATLDVPQGRAGGSDDKAREAPSRGDDAEAPAKPSGSTRELRAKLSKDVRGDRMKDAVATLEALIEADPRAVEDSSVAEDIEAAAVRVAYLGANDPKQTANSDRLFEVLGTKMGPAGPEILYRMATQRGGSAAGDRAKKLLAKEDVRAVAKPSTRIAFELWTARSCQDKAALLDRAKEDGDARALGRLQEMGRGCDMKKDPKLKEAMEAIKARMR